MTTSLIDPKLDADRLRPDPEVDELLAGAIDMHSHPGPSPFPRRINVAEAAQDAASMGFRAIVAKSHHLSMQTEILALRATVLADCPVDVFGGIAMNHTVGGLNPYAAELVLKLGGRIVWFPTISSRAHIKHHHDHPDMVFPQSTVPLREHEPLRVVDEDGRLDPAALDVLDVIAGENAILNCGHLGADEIDGLIPAAVSAGVTKIVVSHPSFIVGASPERVLTWVRLGATIEHCAAMMRPTRPVTQDIFDRYFASSGAERTVLSSDLGQKGNELPVTVIRRIARQLLDNGYEASVVKALTSGNAAALLYE